MERNQRPHSRNKTYGSGSAGVNRGRKVSTGGRPVGSGGQRPVTHNYNTDNSQRGYGYGYSGGLISLLLRLLRIKFVLPLIIVLAIAFSCCVAAVFSATSVFPAETVTRIAATAR